MKQIIFIVLFFLGSSKNDFSSLKPGFTANADLEIETDSIHIVVDEKDLIYQNDSIFVELLNEDNLKVKIPIQTGVSNGIKTSVTEGISVGQKIIVQ